MRYTLQSVHRVQNERRSNQLHDSSKKEVPRKLKNAKCQCPVVSPVGLRIYGPMNPMLSEKELLAGLPSPETVIKLTTKGIRTR